MIILKATVIKCDTEAVLLKLLAYELFNAALSVIGSDVNWDEIISLADKHSVKPLIYRSAKQLADVPDEVLDSLRSSAISSAFRNERMLAIQDEIICLFETRNISCAILKGSSVSSCYPYSEIRTLGDIDILIDASKLSDAGGVLNESGYLHSSGTAFHDCYEGKGVHVELHQAVSKFPDTEKGRYTATYMKDALRYAVGETLGNHRYPVLDVPYQITALLSHVERHMTNTGSSLRQLCDWAVTVDHYRDTIDAAALEILAQCGLLRFAEALTKACTAYLGLPKFDWAEEIPDAVADAMINEIITSGSIQHIDVIRGLSSAFIPGKDTDRKQTTLLGHYVSNTNRKARKEHPHLSKCPLLYPFFWLFYPVRWWIRSLHGEREKINATKTLSIAYQRKKLYGELKLFQ